MLYIRNLVIGIVNFTRSLTGKEEFIQKESGDLFLRSIT